MLRRSGRTSERGYPTPVIDPTRPDAVTGLAAEKSGATSRLTSRPRVSVYGASYSHRTPAFIVTPGATRQSSLKYASYDRARRRVPSLPSAIELAEGIPSRKSAKASPVAAPVNVNVPRGF